MRGGVPLAAAAIALVGAGTAAVLTPAAVTPLPLSFCSPVDFGGTGSPQLLVVSDLPLQGLSSRGSVAMTRAIRFELARQHFRAGKFTVGYQSCDDSNPQSPPGDLSKCSANAKEYAADSSVVGIIGTWSSSCSAIEIPIANEAARGPLPLVSPNNSQIGLTRAAPGTNPGEPGRYYPTGRRNFVRLLAADDVQGVAVALLARHLRTHRMYLLDDKESYGISLGAGFTRAARRVGVAVVGHASWNPSATGFGALARAVKRAHAGGAFLAGFQCPHCDRLIASLREAVGPRGLIAVGDAFSLQSLKKSAGSRGLYGSLLGLAPTQLGSGGRAIVRRFGPGAPDSGGPPYAAESAKVLLDAIAGSDGSRGSVTAHLFSERIRGGILGRFRFDRSGDIDPAGISIYHIAAGRVRLNRTILVKARLFR
jgi:branched-chain amino acid transport system substrate-binding protein